jgi:hypothetical protein
MPNIARSPETSSSNPTLIGAAASLRRTHGSARLESAADPASIARLFIKVLPMTLF